MRRRVGPVSSPSRYERRVADAIWRSLSDSDAVRPSGEWRYFSICVASVLPPATRPPLPRPTECSVLSNTAFEKRSHSTAGLRFGYVVSSSSRFSMNSRLLTSSCGAASNLSYRRSGKRAENSGSPL